MPVAMAATKTPVFCDRETYPSPRTVLVKRQDARHTLSREVQARGRSRTQHAWTTVALDVHFISSLPVILRSACKAWVDRGPVQIVAAED